MCRYPITLGVDPGTIRSTSTSRSDRWAEANDLAVGTDQDFRTTWMAIADIPSKTCAVIGVARLSDGGVRLGPAHSSQVWHIWRLRNTAGVRHEDSRIPDGVIGGRVIP